MSELKNHFRPEFLNRVDDIIMFHSLGREQLKRIVELQLADVGERLAKKELHLEVSDAVKAKLADKGYDPVYGARPLKRVIQKNVADKIARAVLGGLFSKGDTVRVTLENDDIAIEPVHAEATQKGAEA